MQVTYFHHSGVMVELDKHILIFDYYTEGGRYDFLQNPDWKQKDVFVFVSHAHADHYDDRILAWKDDVQYIVSDDVIMKKSDNVTTISPHQTKTVQGVEIKTLQSNDEGVAFLVKTEGKTIYHAGDLNWWHWNGESDTFNNDIAQSYCNEIDLLKGETIDVAFVPVDPRLEDKLCWAADYFMETIGAKTLMPIHFWKNFGVCQALQTKQYQDAVAVITKENETISIP